MEEMVTSPNDELVMKLLRYFISEKNYTPIVIRGVQGEIWLENMEEDYKIVRIVSNYIHNDEQFEFDLFKTKKLMKMIKKKTLSFKMNALSIFVNLNDNVNLNKFEDTPKIDIAQINEEDDWKHFNFIIDKFPDIKPTHWWYDAVNWAASNGVVNGYNDGKFKPSLAISRQQLALILQNYAKFKKKDVSKRLDITKFTDYKKITSYAVDPVSWAIASKVMSGKENGTKVDPQGTATRAQAATMLTNYCTYIGK